MNIELIRKQLFELTTLVESWNQEDEISIIERDIALDRVKTLYAELRFYGDSTLREEESVATSIEPVTSSPQEEVEEDEEFAEVEVEITYYEGEDEEEETESQESEEAELEEESEEEPLMVLSLDDILIVEDEQLQEEETPNVEESSIEEETPIEEKEEVAPPKNGVVERALFDLDTIPVREKKSRRRAILSLYTDEELPVPTPSYSIEESSTEYVEEPEPIEEKEMELEEPQEAEESQEAEYNADFEPRGEIEIVEELIIEDDPQAEIIEEEVDSSEEQEEPSILAETLSPNVETLADRYASEQQTDRLENDASQWQSVPLSSINDRYIVAQELFGGDMAAFEKTLADINAIENFDDCMIYIVENFDWNPDDEATKLILGFLEYKFALN